MGRMFDKKDFEGIRARLGRADKQREVIIKDSRDIIKLSKQVINLVHRSELKLAEPHVKNMQLKMKALRKEAAKELRLSYIGSFKAAEQEFVEAMTFFEWMKNGKIPTSKDLGVDDEHFILGICDLPGELVRKAINAVINEDYKTATTIRDLVTDIYEELSKFHFLSGELRRKYDSIKYDLKRLDDLILELKIRGTI